MACGGCAKRGQLIQQTMAKAHQRPIHETAKRLHVVAQSMATDARRAIQSTLQARRPK